MKHIYEVGQEVMYQTWGGDTWKAVITDNEGEKNDRPVYSLTVIDPKYNDSTRARDTFWSYEYQLTPA